MIHMFIDTTKCIGCKACQVACKQWHSLPAESTSFTGSYTNPPDLSDKTLTYVKFTEFVRGGKLKFLFFKNQCMHCVRPKCQKVCPAGVERTSDGFVIFNEFCTPDYMSDKIGNEAAKKDAFIASCKFNIPRWSDSLDRFVKCDLCYDRFGSGSNCTYKDGKPTTACELTCPAGAIVTGTNDKDIRNTARARFAAVRKNGNRYASLYSGNYGRTNVIYLLAERPKSYNLTGLLAFPRP